MPTPRPLPSQHLLKHLLDYDPSTGVLRWNATEECCPKVIGKPAGTQKGRYGMIGIDKVIFMTSRVIWKWMTGSDPNCIIDHINGNKFDNRWCNLREATHSQNIMNTRLLSRNTSGVRNVTFNKHSGKFDISIKAQNKIYYKRGFTTLEEATAHAVQIRQQLHGSFFRK
jgi:hypothetical protein